MCLKTLNDNLKSISEFLKNDQKIVTYKWLSNTLSLPIPKAKRLLHQYAAESKREDDDDDLSVYYLVSGTQKTDGYQGHYTTLVPAAELDSAMGQLDSPTSQVYAVAKGAPAVSELLEADKEASKFHVIKFKAEKKTPGESSKLKEESASKPSQSETSSSKAAPPREVAAPKSQPMKPKKPDVTKYKSEPQSKSRKAAPPSKVKGKGSSDVRNLFSKQAASSKKVPSPKKAPSPKKNPTPVKEEKLPFDTESEEEEEEEEEERPRRTKRRRIVAMSDDSEEEEPPTAAEVGDTPMAKEEEEPMEVEPEESIPPTPPSSTTRRSFQTVSQTFQDKDGFMVTRREKVCVEENLPAQEEKPPAPKPAAKKAPPSSKASPSSKPAAKKQANLMAFFGKKS